MSLVAKFKQFVNIFRSNQYVSIKHIKKNSNVKPTQPKDVSQHNLETYIHVKNK